MSKDQNNNSIEEKDQQPWSTWEELLLACAVKRHGFNDWDSVAMEVQTRSSLSHLLISAQNCQQKYLDLKRRFTVIGGNDKLIDHESDPIPWLEDLRKLRVAELKREVQRYDVSILSLQSKVKRLEKDREERLREDDNCQSNPDLDRCRELAEPETGHIAGKSFSGENLSVNGSNSTAVKGDNVEDDQNPVHGGLEKLDPVSSAAKPAVEDSYNGSSEPIVEIKGDDSDVVTDSVTESKESNDVQSSASLTRNKTIQRKRAITGEDPPETRNGVNGIKRMSMTSEPLVGVFEAVRSHKHSSLFERRLKSQEAERYNSLVKQHLDLETVRIKLEDGSYSVCTATFYRDLLLLFSNAIVFFSKSSLESITANELRNLVCNQMHEETQIHVPSLDPHLSPPIAPQLKLELCGSDSLLSNQKSAAPILVCRKRSSVSTKPLSTGLSNKFKQRVDEKQPVSDLKPVVESEEHNLGKIIETKEKSVTGNRSLRRGTKNQTNSSIKTTSKKPVSNTSSADKGAIPKVDKKIDEEELPVDKKRSAADFLKRIKQNSPMEANKNGGGERKKLNGKGYEGKERVLRRNGGAKEVNDKEVSPSKRSVGRPPKKELKGATTRKRERRGGRGNEVAASKRPKKRSKR